MQSIEQQLEKVNQQIEEKKRQRSQLKAQVRAQKRKAETRRKILIGAAVEAMFKNDTGGLWMRDGEQLNAKSLEEVLDRTIQNESDRKFLGL